MIRNLLKLAGASFVLSLGCIAGASMLAQRDLSQNNWGWTLIEQDDGFKIDKGSKQAIEPKASRTLNFAPTEALKIDFPHDVIFKQGPVASLVVEGPKSMIERVSLKDGLLFIEPGTDFKKVIRFQLTGKGIEARGNMDDLKVTITAPNIHQFTLLGSGDLEIENYDQTSLDLNILGSGDIRAKGRAKTSKITISGSGTVDAKALNVQNASVDIDGSGEAHMAPTEVADIKINGSGDVVLETKPRSLTIKSLGSGSVIGQDGEEMEP